MTERVPVAGVRRGRVRAGSASDPGRVRTGNEDRVYVDAAQGIFIVADGVGGHAAGEVAAQIAVDVIPQRLARASSDRVQAMREAIALANNEIHAQAAARPEYAGMTCVLTAAHLHDGRVTIGHVGDTRAYRLDANGMRKITHDHSPIGEREDAGELAETEAMRHPRRNEVFRDVGSAFHAPDDPDFVEVFETTFAHDGALLLCSDGLSDMVTSGAIDRTVRAHAGDPDRVAEALILAANEAGGRDNVSVIYVEGERFAAPAASLPDGIDAGVVPAPLHAGPRRSHAGRWFVAGLVAGLAAGLGVAWFVAVDDPVALAGARVLDVSRSAGSPYLTIADALAGARPGDTVRLAPGEYAEAVVVPDGVHLEARDPGTVTLGPPPGMPDAVVLTATGGVGSRLNGLRIAGTSVTPGGVGVRVTGAGVELEDVTIAGALQVGLDLGGAAGVTVRASRLTGIEGIALRAAPGSRPAVVRSVFVGPPDGRGRALDIPGGTDATFEENLFVGFPELTRGDAPGRRLLLPHNLVLPAPASLRRGAQ